MIKLNYFKKKVIVKIYNSKSYIKMLQSRNLNNSHVGN